MRYPCLVARTVFWFLSAVWLLSFASFPAPAQAGGEDRYFLQVGSFQSKTNALRLKSQLEELELRTELLEKTVPPHGILHQVLVGPFDSWKTADGARLTLRKAGVFLEDAFVVRKSTPPAVQKTGKETLPAAAAGETIAPVAEPRPEDRPLPSGKGEPPPAAAAGVPAGRIELKPTVALEPKTLPAEERRVERKPAAPETEPGVFADGRPAWGGGRNLRRGSFALSYRHSYVNYATELQQRTAVSTAGGIATTVPVSSGLEQIDVDTSMHLDLLRIRFGVTDDLEIYGDIGAAYRDLATPSAVYGGGARLNWMSLEWGETGALYGALQGDFLVGELESEVETDDGNRWKKEADWQSFDFRLELGARFSRWALFGGGSYALYDESTRRTLLTNIPAPLTGFAYQDEVELDSPWGAFGGVTYYLTPKVRTDIEGGVGSRQRVSGQIQVDF